MQAQGPAVRAQGAAVRAQVWDVGMFSSYDEDDLPHCELLLQGVHYTVIRSAATVSLRESAVQQRVRRRSECMRST